MSTASKKTEVLSEPFRIDLEDDETRENQLASSQYNNDGQDENNPRETLAWKTAAMFEFQISPKIPVVGLYEGKQACLLAFNLDFSTKLGHARCKSARIELEFVDSEEAHLSPHDPQGPAMNRPRILSWSPEEYHGPVTSDPIDWNVQGGAGVTDPSNIVNFNAIGSRQGKTIRQGHELIKGRKKDSPLIFDAIENKRL